MPSPSPFKVIHPILYHPGKLNSYETQLMTICDNFLARADGTQEHPHKYPQAYTELQPPSL